VGGGGTVVGVIGMKPVTGREGVFGWLIGVIIKRKISINMMTNNKNIRRDI
jgi:hypothetical protein